MKTPRTFGRHVVRALILTALVLALSYSLAAAMVASSDPAMRSPSSHASLASSTPGVLNVSSEVHFLSLTGSLPGSLSTAKWQWRTGSGAATRWWLNVEGGNLFLFPKGNNAWNADQPTSASNYLALGVPLQTFQGWFWCGVPVRDRFHRFTGYGCDPVLGPKPAGQGELAPWIQATLAESRGHVWQVLGAYCVIRRTDHIQIEPACPVEGEVVKITVMGNWGKACPVVGHATLRDGRNFQFDVTVRSQEDAACSSVLTGWSFTEEVGALQPGSYRVQVNMTDTETGYWGFVDVMSFDVVAAPDALDETSTGP